MKIGYLNYAFRESQDLTLSGATVETGELANLRKPQLDQRVTVSGSGTDSVAMHIQDIPADYSGRTVQVVALLDVAIEIVGTVDSVAWSVDVQGSTGGVTAEPVTVPEMPDGFPRHLLFLLDEPVTDCQLVRIYLDATGTGEIELALTASALWIGPTIAIEDGTNTGLQEGSSFGIEDAGSIQRTPGGQVYSESSSALRTHSGSTIHLPRALAFGDGTGAMDIQQLMVSVRTTGPILWMPYTSSDHLLHRTCIYGHFTQLGRLIPRGPYDRWEGWAVREAR